MQNWRFWTWNLNKQFALNTLPFSCLQFSVIFTKYDSGLLVVDLIFQKWTLLVLLQWDLDHGIFNCICLVCWGNFLVLIWLTTSKTVWLIWWFLNTLANLMMNPADYFQHTAVCFHTSFVLDLKTHLYGLPMAHLISLQQTANLILIMESTITYSY